MGSVSIDHKLCAIETRSAVLCDNVGAALAKLAWRCGLANEPWSKLQNCGLFIDRSDLPISSKAVSSYFLEPKSW